MQGIRLCSKRDLILLFFLFVAGTAIQYTLPQTSTVQLAIYNVVGQRLRVLVNERQAAGVHSIRWEGANAAGERLPSGTYFYEINTETLKQRRKLLLFK